MRAWLRDERGQTGGEYLGALLIVGVLISILVTSSVGAKVSSAIQSQVACIAAGADCAEEGEDSGGSGGSGPGGGTITHTSADAAERDAMSLQERVEALDDLADRGGVFDDLRDEASAALARGDHAGAREAIERLEWYQDFIDAGPRGNLLAEIDGPDASEWDDLVADGDIYLDGGETTRRFFDVDPEPGRGVVAFDFFIPSANSNGFRGDDRDEAGTNVLRSDLDITESRVMIVIDYETGRAVIAQSETHLDGPWGLGGANEPRPIALNGSLGPWSHEGGTDLDQTQQVNLSSDENGMHVDWDILNSQSPFVISVDGDVDFGEGGDGFLHTNDFANQDLVDRYPQIQVYQYRPDGTEREIARNDYQGGHIPILGGLPQCNLPNGPNLPTVGIGGFEIVDLPDIGDGPSVPGPC